jgi:hypothetical protein
MELQFLHKKAKFSSSDGTLNLAMNANTEKLSAKFKSKVLLVIFFLMFTIAGFSQSKFSFGVSGGYDHSFNFLTGLPITNSDLYPDFNIGVDGILNLGEKIRIRGELGYENLNFTHKYNSTSTSSTRIDKSVLSISNLDFIPRVDYKLLSSGKFDLFASAGFKFEFALGSFERTTLANGDKSEFKYMSNILGDYTKVQAGAVGGFIVKYNVSQYFGVTLAPDYTYFFDKFQTRNDNNMQRVGVNLGVEWKF